MGMKNQVNVPMARMPSRSEEHTSELQSQSNLVCRLLLENKNIALVAIDMSRPATSAVSAFYAFVRKRYPYALTFRRDLSPAEVVRCTAVGSRFAADRFAV